MNPKSFILLIFIFYLSLTTMLAEGQVTKGDYERIDTLLKRSEKVYSPAVKAHWIGNTHEFWYMNQERKGNIYYLVDAKKGTKKTVFDTDKLAKAIREITGDTVISSKLPISNLNFHSKDELDFIFKGKSWNYKIAQNKLIRLDNKETEKAKQYGQSDFHTDTAKVISPDNKWLAYIKDHNVYIRSIDGTKGTALTTDGTIGLFYSSQLSWSPDSKKLITLKIRDVKEREIPLIESAPESQKQPILKWKEYAKPGDVLPVCYPVLFHIDTKKQIPIDAKPYSNQYWLHNTGWRKDSRAFTFEFNQRGHQRYIVAEVNATSGNIRTIAEEQSETFIHYYRNYRYDLKDGAEMLWISERDGWRHIYLLDGRNGKVKQQLTKGEWIVRDIEFVDEEKEIIYFTASGHNPGEDPYNLHYCTIRLDGSDFKDITPENGNHQVVFSQNKEYYVDVYSRPDFPPVSQLKRTSDASIILELEKCDISDLIADGWQAPQVFCAKGRDGITDIWGNIIRPSHFDPSKKYPVIEMIYAGPHDSHVDKNFRPAYHLISRLADLGFIVVSIDGMGTSNRSKAFHDICWKNLKDAGFPDRINWIKAAAAKYSHMDISKVGIYGWSAGGQNAMAALLFHSDFYKVAVAFCGCHDNRMDKIWWNEQWMGYPIDESYSACSNVDNAHLLNGKLFLINGELDENVDPASTLQIVNALVKANKNFEQLYLPGKGHSLGGSFEMRRMHDFFVKNILDQEPPEWEE